MSDPIWAKAYRWCGHIEQHPPHAWPEVQTTPKGEKQIVMWPCGGDREQDD